MQAVFFISLFSLVFAMFSGITAGLSKNIIQSNIEKTRQTEQKFANIENVITKILLKEKHLKTGAVVGSTDPNDYETIVDFSDSKFLKLDGDYISRYSNYTLSDLTLDPWKSPIYLLQQTEQKIVWASSAVNNAAAPITYFMLVSPGPNGIYDMFDNLGINHSTGSPTMTLDQLKRSVDLTDKSIVEDDIITRFSNYDAMLDIWQKATDLDNATVNAAHSYYKNMLDAFSPLIQLAQRDITMTGGSLLGSVFENITLPTVDVNGDGTINHLDITDTYAVFDDLQNASNSDTLVNEWNDPTTEIHNALNDGILSFSPLKQLAIDAINADGSIVLPFPITGWTWPSYYENTRSFSGFRGSAKVYEDEFIVVEPDVSNIDFTRQNGTESAGAYRLRVMPLLQDAIDEAVSVSSDNFKTRYPGEFIYPSFDAVIRSDGGTDLTLTDEDGLQHLGISNLKSMDPFAGLGDSNGELTYTYTDSVPNIISIERNIDTGNVKQWKIQKTVVVDGLGNI